MGFDVAKLQWDMFFSESISFPLSVSFHQFSMLVSVI